MDRARVAIVTGCHAFEVPAFYALLRSLPEIDFYPQHLDNFVADFGQARQDYDAVVFYNYHRQLADDDGGRMKGALEQLGETEQGIVIWHHGLVALLGWPTWSALCGIQDRTFTAHKGQSLRVEVVDPKHPITRTLATSAWEMVDEAYAMDSAGEDSHVLLAAHHPRSLRTLAWTRSHGRARVFCYQSGHGGQAYACEQFRTLFARGVLWAARRDREI